MALVRVFEWVGTCAWTASVGLVIVRVAVPGDSWAAPLLAFALTLAATASASAAVMRTIPAPYLSWQRGVEYGRMLEREEASKRGPGLRRLSSVR